MSLYATQEAIYNAITSNAMTLLLDFENQEYGTRTAEQSAALTFLSQTVKGVYDNPPQVDEPEDPALFPYITISDTTSPPWDDDHDRGFAPILTVHVWSRASHALEAKQIMDAVYSILHRGTLAITGWQFVGCDLTDQTILRDPDGITRHGVQNYRVTYWRSDT